MRKPYASRPCDGCKEAFTPRSNSQRVCDGCNALTCSQCGATYRKPPSQRVSGKPFCSRACHLEYQKRNNSVTACKQCGSEYAQAPWEKDRMFCGAECFSKWRGGHFQEMMGRELKCRKCGTSFRYHAQRAFCDDCRNIKCAECGKVAAKKTLALEKENGQLFCGRGYSWAYFRKNGFIGPKKTVKSRPCRWCGTSFRPKQERPAIACSMECWRQLRQNGHFKRRVFSRHYGANWREQRAKARARDVACTRCGVFRNESGSDLHVHHIIPFRVFGVSQYKKANHLSNLTTLCDKCHRIVEAESDPFPIQPNLFTGKVSW